MPWEAPEWVGCLEPAWTPGCGLDPGPEAGLLPEGRAWQPQGSWGPACGSAFCCLRCDMIGRLLPRAPLPPHRPPQVTPPVRPQPLSLEVTAASLLGLLFPEDAKIVSVPSSMLFLLSIGLSHGQSKRAGKSSEMGTGIPFSLESQGKSCYFEWLRFLRSLG